MKTIFNTVFAAALAAVLAICPTCGANRDGLAVETSDAGKAYLAYKGEPLFAFGPGDEVRIISGSADVQRWVDWQRGNGMNLIRAYPTSVPIEAYGAPGLAPFRKQGDKWDVDAFDDDYFNHLGEVAKTLEKNDIILHLQLWQIVFFKDGDRRWDINFLNPRNNGNEWTQTLARGRDYIDAPDNSAARAHQKQWVHHILDALKGRSNVIIDVINELSNEMGTIEWAVEVTRWIDAWEQENNGSFIVGVDSEHHYTPERFGPHREHFDIVILNELQRYERGVQIGATFNMPLVSVRSSDGTNTYDDYMFARADQTGPEHQTRYRTLCYRSIFAGLQSVGAYWKSQIEDADYRAMENWPDYARALRTFWELLAGQWPQMNPVTEVGWISGAVTPHAYGLKSTALLAVYLDCGARNWNISYPASVLRVRCDFPQVAVEYFNPRTGEIIPMSAERDGEFLLVSLPAFTDDAVILIKSTGANAS